MKFLISAISAALFFILTASTSISQTLGPLPFSGVQPVEAEIGIPARLDPTGGFSAIPGVALRVQWSWEARPSLSVAQFDAPTALRPSFTPDVDGTYVALARFYSATDLSGATVLHQVRVLAGTENLPPVAGVRARAVPGGLLPLKMDGTPSYDVNGQPLTYQWSVVSVPSGGSASFSSATSPMPDVSLVGSGTFTLGLRVQDSDGLQSELATFVVQRTTDRRLVPVAELGLDHIAAASGTTVALSPYGSTDLDGESLTASGGVVFAPAGTEVDLLASEAGSYRLPVTAAGDYIVSLATSDGIFTGFDQVLVAADGNVRPTARIAPVRVALGQTAQLDGSQSHDLNGDLLSYQWATLVKPAASQSMIVNASSPIASFVPDAAGLYVFQLEVSDGTLASLPQTIAVVVGASGIGALPEANAGLDQIPANGSFSLNAANSLTVGQSSFAWSSIGLTGVAAPVVSLPDAVQTGADFSATVGPFNEVIRTKPVYHFKRAQVDDGYCAFDTRVPSNIAGAPVEPISMTLHSRGRQTLSTGSILIWEIENKTQTTRTVNLRDSLGASHGSWVLPGRTSIHVKTANIGSARMDARVGTTVAASDTAKSGPFNRNNPVCMGVGASVFQLIVSDQNGISLPDTLVVANANLAPASVRPEGVTSLAGVTNTLSSAGLVTDENGDTISYIWSLVHKPAASSIVVGQGNGTTFDITPDVAGYYLVQLVASDGTWIAQPVVFVIEVPNAPPVAAATGPAEVFVGQTATFDGTGSSDPDGNALNYIWQITSAPAGSATSLTNSTSPVSALVPDKTGTYVISLVVSDFEFSSSPVTLTLVVPNRSPEASLAAPTDVFVDDEVALSAAASSDPDGDTLTYSFSVVSAPAGSAAELIQTGSDAVLMPDRPGDYRVSVTVSDGTAQDTAEVLLTARPRNTAPVLAELDPTYIVELGLKFHLQLAGSDPDGDAITYFATPIPLPAGMTLNTSTGLVQFRPEQGQEGTYTLTFGVSDGVLTDIETITLTVAPANAGDTALTGRVLDAVDFAVGIETPLAGIPVRLRDSALSMVTDANGEFSFGSLTRSSDVVLVEPSASGGPGGYIGTSRSVRVTANQIRDIDPDFLLTPLNDGCAPVVAGTATILSSAQSGVTVTIPADSVSTAAGTAYAGDVCLGSLPQLFADPGLPQDTAACHIYALAAPGAVFTQALTISAPNADQLPQATSLELWRAGGAGSTFRRAASAGVDAGGATVSGQLLPLGDGALFTFLPQAPQTVAAADMPTGNTSLTPFTGDLSETYVLPGYRAFGRDQQVAISYHSKAADPTVIAAGEVTIAANASLPLGLSTVLRIGGLSIIDSAEWTPRLRSDGYVPALIGEAVSFRQAVPVDATGLPSGRYDYDFVAKAKYACSTVAAQHETKLPVQNQTTSPYGNGWSIDGLQQLVVAEDGSVSIIDDDGVSTFDPEPTLTEFEDEPLVFPTVGTQSVSIFDYDGDGQLDVTYAASGTGALGLIRSLGGREMVFDREFVFANTNTVPPTGIYTPNLLETAPGDLDADGAIDLAFGLQTESAYGYLRNDGFGSFSEQPLSLASGTLRSPKDVAVVDMDGDGWPDTVGLSSRNLFGTGSVSVYVSYGSPTGPGNLVTLASTAHSGSALQLEIADIDGNGRLDIMWRLGANSLRTVYQTGSRTFTSVSTPAVSVTGFINLLGEYFKLADFNGDGKQDIVWGGTNNLTVYLNANTTGRTFLAGAALARPPFAGTAMNVHIADANGDDLPDIIVSEASNVAVYVGNGDGTFQPFETGFVNYSIGDVAFADIDGDGSLDMVSAQRFSVRVHFSKPSATGKFKAGKGEYSTLTKLPDGTYERRYKDGTKAIFDATGRQTGEMDAQGNLRSFAYDADNRLLTITDQVGGVTEFFYEPVYGRLSLIRYPDGRETAFTFDDAGNLEEIVEPSGATVNFSYDVNNRLVSTTNQNGNTTAYSYDATGQMNGATLPDGSTIRNQVAASLGLVDGLGNQLPNPLAFIPEDQRVTTVTDRKGLTTTIEVNQFGATVMVTDPLGRVTKIDRDDGNLAVRVERPSATGGIRVDEMEYDAVANVTRMVEAAGTPQERETLYDYEPIFSKVTRMVDPGGFEMLYEYDPTGLVTKITDAETGERLFSYLPDGMLSSRTDENGNLTGFVYNATKNLDTITYADGSVTDISYDSRGNTTLVAEAFGLPEERRILRTYDSLNRLLTLEVTGPDGVQIDGLTSYSYDPAGNLDTVTDETGLVTSMDYDSLERLVALDDPAEGLIERTYNAAGEVIEHINGDGEVHAYSYDAVSRLTGTTDPEGYVKAFAYDPRDNVTTVTDGRGGITTFTYDVLDRMTGRTNPLGLTMGRAYDSRDNLTLLTREDGLTETATYDGLGRRTGVVTPDNTLSYGFDEASNLIFAADSDSRVTFTWDARNRLATAATDGTLGPQPAITLTYAYDGLDRRVTMADSLGGTTAYDWDAEDRLATLTAPWGTVWTFGYDGEGRRTSLTSSTGRITSYGYTNSLLTALSHAQSGVMLTDLAYAYGPDGQLTAMIDNLDPAKSEVYAYDDLNRLLQVAEGVPLSQGGVPVPVEDYAYDGEGNRTASHLSAAHLSSDHNQLLEDDNYTYAYDARGNRISRTSKTTGDVETYTYDSQNRLIGYTSPTTDATYAYDALDRRIAKTVDGVETAYVYDMSADDPLAYDDITLEFTDGILTRRWAHSDAVDEPLGLEAYASQSGVGTGAERAIYADRQGSVIWVTDPATGTVVAAYEYDAYGQLTQTAGTLAQPYGYTGREYDAESGLYHYRARAYDPAAGVFLQVDPIEFVGGPFNLQSYVDGNPVNANDASGLMSSIEYREKAGKDAATGTVGSTLIGVALIELMGRALSEVADSPLWDGRFDVKGPKGKARPGDCSLLMLNELQAEVDKIRTPACLPPAQASNPQNRLVTRMTNLQKMRNFSKKALAQAALNNTCFRGGDSGHQEKLSILLGGMLKCNRYIQKF